MIFGGEESRRKRFLSDDHFENIFYREQNISKHPRKGEIKLFDEASVQSLQFFSKLPPQVKFNNLIQEIIQLDKGKCSGTNSFRKFWHSNSLFYNFEEEDKKSGFAVVKPQSFSGLQPERLSIPILYQGYFNSGLKQGFGIETKPGNRHILSHYNNGEKFGPSCTINSEEKVEEAGIYNNDENDFEFRIFGKTRYVGETFKGCKLGKGIFIDEFSKYEGQFLANVYHGYGHKTMGMFHQMGIFNNNKLVLGKGYDLITGHTYDIGIYLEGAYSKIRTSKYVFEGEVFSPTVFKRGCMYYTNGDMYFGYFNYDSQYHHFGVLIIRDNYLYEGEFKDGKKNGYGSMFWKNGNIFRGKFVNDCIDGYGVLFLKSENTKIGYFKTEANGMLKFIRIEDQDK